jgi:hypothetical protein
LSHTVASAFALNFGRYSAGADVKFHTLYSQGQQNRYNRQKHMTVLSITCDILRGQGKRLPSSGHFEFFFSLAV